MARQSPRISIVFMYGGYTEQEDSASFDVLATPRENVVAHTEFRGSAVLNTEVAEEAEE